MAAYACTFRRTVVVFSIMIVATSCSSGQNTSSNSKEKDTSAATGDSENSDDLDPLPQEFLGLVAISCQEVQAKSKLVTDPAELGSDRSLLACAVTNSDGSAMADTARLKKTWDFYSEDIQIIPEKIANIDNKVVNAVLNFPTNALEKIRVDCTLSGKDGASGVLKTTYNRTGADTAVGFETQYDLSCAAVEGKELADPTEAPNKRLIGCNLHVAGNPESVASLFGLNLDWKVKDKVTTDVLLAVHESSFYSDWKIILSVPEDATNLIISAATTANDGQEAAFSIEVP